MASFGYYPNPGSYKYSQWYSGAQSGHYGHHRTHRGGQKRPQKAENASTGAPFQGLLTTTMPSLGMVGEGGSQTPNPSMPFIVDSNNCSSSGPPIAPMGAESGRNGPCSLISTSSNWGGPSRDPNTPSSTSTSIVGQKLTQKDFKKSVQDHARPAPTMSSVRTNGPPEKGMVESNAKGQKNASPLEQHLKNHILPSMDRSKKSSGYRKFRPFDPSKMARLARNLGNAPLGKTVNLGVQKPQFGPHLGQFGPMSMSENLGFQACQSFDVAQNGPQMSRKNVFGQGLPFNGVEHPYFHAPMVEKALLSQTQCWGQVGAGGGVLPRTLSNHVKIHVQQHF